jgi:hypothetical protein
VTRRQVRPQEHQREPDQDAHGDRLGEQRNPEHDGHGRVHVGDDGRPRWADLGHQGEEQQ